MSRLRSCASGQASVELVAVLPVVAVLAFGLWQGVVAGHTAWMAAVAARGAARASEVGSSGSASSRARAAAGAVLSARLRRGMDVRVSDDDGSVRVRLRIPSVVPGGPALPVVSASARFSAR